MTLAFFGTPGGPEIILILLVVLLLFGAKRLPEIARSLGRSMEEFRRAARDVTDEIMHADLEAKKPAAPKPLPPMKPVEPAVRGGPGPGASAPSAPNDPDDESTI
jgi:sec-independent protein translocase protein TatA